MSSRAKNASPSGGNAGQKKRRDSPNSSANKPRRNSGRGGGRGGRGSGRGTGGEQKSRLKSTAGNGNQTQDGDSPSTNAQEKPVQNSSLLQQLRLIPWYQWCLYLLILIISCVIAFWIERKNRQREWHLLLWYGCICIILAIGDGSPRQFFKPLAEDNIEGKKCEAFCLLTMTSFISWVMAKSVQNSSKLGAKYGVVGGLAYGAWFVGVFTSGLIIYYLRSQGYYSLPDFIHNRYGPLACIVFLLTVMYRLFNEVWSNTIVIADFFGERNSANWELAAWVSMGIPAAYTIIGGMRASLWSDALQTVLMCVLLGMTYWKLNQGINNDSDLKKYAEDMHDSSILWKYNPDPSRKMWSLEGGLDLLYTGLIQGALSYTFMDPALTDRAFLASKEVMLGAFALGSLMAIAYITIFGFIGIYGNMVASCVENGACPESKLNGATLSSVKDGYPSYVGTVLGGKYYTLLCLVIITSALSTLDSTFSAVAKVVGPDLRGYFRTGAPIDPVLSSVGDVWVGRFAILVIGVTGTLPMLYEPDELSATTVTGTMVPGLGPPIYMAAFACLLSTKLSGRVLSSGKQRPIMFLLPFCFSASLGTVYQLVAQTDLNCYPSKLVDCSTPSYGLHNATACGSYSLYYQCIFDSGCWKKTIKDDCRLAEELIGGSCSLACHEGDTKYETTVDLSGFEMGEGAYRRLFGVNVISAIGALGLFIFACGDDVLGWQFNKAASANRERELAAALARNPMGVTGLNGKDLETAL